MKVSEILTRRNGLMEVFFASITLSLCYSPLCLIELIYGGCIQITHGDFLGMALFSRISFPL